MTRTVPGWAETNLGEIGEYLNGRGFKKSEWRDVGRPIIRIQNLTGTSDQFNYFAGEPEEHYIAHPGDILVSWAATLGVFVWAGPEAVVNQHIFKVRSLIDLNFHRYLLESVLGDLRRQTHGSGMVHITKSRFESTPVLLPPLAEQKRIVAAIEEQFSRLDAGVAALEHAHAKLALLRDRSILSLIEGSASRQLLGEVAEIRLGRQRSPANHTGPNMHSYLRAANVTWTGLDLTDVKEMNFSPSEVETYALRAGDVLVAEASGSASEVGKPAIWDGSIATCCFQNTLLRVRSNYLTPDYLYLVLLALARSGTFARASRGVGIHHLSKAGLSGLEVEVPTLATQRRLVDAIRRQQDRVQALESALTMGLGRARRLRSSVLSAAFCGKLVPQDPMDEPAAALVEQIAGLHTSSNDAVTKNRQRRRKATA